jgi:hypothetical protein
MTRNKKASVSGVSGLKDKNRIDLDDMHYEDDEEENRKK